MLSTNLRSWLITTTYPVQMSDVARLEQQLGKLYTHAPASREFTRRPVEVRALEPETQQSFLHILLKVGHVDGIELLRESRHLLYELHVFFALVVGTGGEFVVDAVDFCLNLVQMGESLARLIKYSTSVFGHQMLWQISYDAILKNR